MADQSNPAATRRQFFRLLGQQTATNAGNLWGTVNALRRSGAEAASELLGTAPAATRLDDDAPARAAVGADFRSAYRLAGDRIVILDQRALPDAALAVECTDASEVAAAIRAGAVGGGPVLGQLAAHTCYLAVARLSDRSARQRRAALAAAAATLRACRPTQQSIRHALSRLEAADAALGDEVDGPTHAAALLAEAEALALAAALDHGELGRVGAEVLASARPAPADALNVLVHGDGGALSGGLVGTSFAVLAALGAAGRRLHAWLTDAGPSFEGRRAGAFQLGALGVPHTVVADTALGWLFDHRRIDAVLLRADWVCANGDVVAPLGSLNVARLVPAGVPVYASAPRSVIDPATANGADVPPEFRAPASGVPGPRLDPAADVVPAALLSGLITAGGLIEPLLGEGLAAAGRAAAAETVG